MGNEASKFCIVVKFDQFWTVVLTLAACELRLVFCGNCDKTTKPLHPPKLLFTIIQIQLGCKSCSPLINITSIV